MTVINSQLQLHVALYIILLQLATATLVHFVSVTLWMLVPVNNDGLLLISAGEGKRSKSSKKK